MIAFLFVTLALALGVFLLYFWITTIIDVIKSDFKEKEHKYLWLIAILIFPFCGSIVYHFVGHQFKGRNEDLSLIHI